jgi:hypothetical protein
VHAKDYFDKVEMYINGLTDLEFENLLVEAGIEAYPSDEPLIYAAITVKSSSLYGETSLYSSRSQHYSVILDGVA